MDAPNFDSFDWSECAFGPGYCRSIFEFCQEHQFKTILEVGFDSGSSALAILRALPKATLLSIDIASELPMAASLIQRNIPDWEARHVFMRNADSRTLLPVMVQDGHKFDMVYVDGDHEYEPAKSDIENAWKLLDNGGYLVVDDADPSHAHFGCGRAAYEFAQAMGVEVQPLPQTPNMAVYLIKP